MKKFRFFFATAIWLFVQGFTLLHAQQTEFQYKASASKINDLIHTKLDLHFNYQKCCVYGKAWLTLRPNFYPTDTLRLDARGMDLKSISIVKNGKNIPLVFTYDSVTVAIRLDKVYRQNEPYTVYIEYTANPARLKVKNDEHGLYFIKNPDQIWTTGQPNYNSAWFPTIDEPNQKCTDEISLTVPAKYVTLSNGRLANQQKHSDGTRTDTWKMELPHSPYLFMIAVGDFTIIKDSWHGKEVNYYVQPQYAKDARAIFGYTPEAMAFFSGILGVDFPWNKYAQIRVHGFNGGMENTSATVVNEDGQSSPRELADLPYQSGNVHELFHQWFGDYVTCVSWSNLALNESFADLGEILWAEHKFGQDVADEHVYQGEQGYLNSADAWKEDLIRFYYAKKQDMFDGVTYQKGGRILNMLRHYLGNAAFYKGLHLYLTENAFDNADAQQLRMAMEEASGLDLNWFFNEWFYNAGHPVLDISYHWDESSKKQYVYIKQEQNWHLFTLPCAVDIYANGLKVRYNVWLSHLADTLSFNAAAKPDMVNVDADKILLAKKTEHKSMAEYAFQYSHAPLFMDRCEAIDTAATHQQNPLARQILVAALTDNYYGLRIKTMRALDMDNDSLRVAALPLLIHLAMRDTCNLAKAEAITQLGKLKIKGNLLLLKEVLQNTISYAVQGAALNAIGLLDTAQAFGLAKTYEKDSKGKLRDVVINIYIKSGGNAEWPYVYHNFADNSSPLQYSFTGRLADFAGRVKNPVYAQQGIEAIADLVIELKKFDSASKFIAILDRVKANRLKIGDQASANAADRAIARIKSAR
jgi:aminopeptidase N